MPFHIVAKCTVHQKGVWLERCETKLNIHLTGKCTKKHIWLQSCTVFVFLQIRFDQKFTQSKKQLVRAHFHYENYIMTAQSSVQLNTARDEGNGDRLQKDLSQLTERFVHFLSL